MRAASERLNIFERIFNSLIKRDLRFTATPRAGFSLCCERLLGQIRFNSFLPLRLFCKEPINNFHIAMHLLGSMNLFSDFAAILEGL